MVPNNPALEGEEGKDYITCPGCGIRHFRLYPYHVRVCCGTTTQEYREKFGPMVSEKAREAQSQKLKARFQTPEGESTRRQISESSKRMQTSEPGQRSQARFKRLASDPDWKEKQRADTKARWESGNLRETVEGWHREHRDESLSSALHARRYIQRKRTGLRMRFKALMESKELTGFVTEYEVGYHAIDEARPDLKVGVEIDGCYWHSCPQCGLKGPRDTLRTDKAKTAYLTHRGWTVLRIWEHDINRDPMGCLDRIRQLIADKERENHAG